MALRLVRHIRRLRGGSQPQLMRGADDCNYVVKVQHNPQGNAVLANEYAAARLAAILGLPVPHCEIVELSAELSEQIYFETEQGRIAAVPGLQFGSREAMPFLEGRTYSASIPIPTRMLRNPEAWAGAFVFDLWTCNTDFRQALYCRGSREKKYNLLFIDNGHCLGGPKRSFTPVRALAGHAMCRFDDLAPWMARLRKASRSRIEHALSSVPEQWLGKAERTDLLLELERRRHDLLEIGRSSTTTARIIAPQLASAIAI